MTSNSFTLNSFLNANSDKKLDSVDYIHAIFHLNGLPIDFVLCVTQLTSPDFKVVDGAFFLAEQFDMDEYKTHLSEGRSERECQTWMNLIELTGVFDTPEAEKVLKLAHIIMEAWNIKLANELVRATGEARVIHDKDTEEVFITID